MFSGVLHSEVGVALSCVIKRQQVAPDQKAYQ